MVGILQNFVAVLATQLLQNKHGNIYQPLRNTGAGSSKQLGQYKSKVQ